MNETNEDTKQVARMTRETTEKIILSLQDMPYTANHIQAMSNLIDALEAERDAADVTARDKALVKVERAIAQKIPDPDACSWNFRAGMIFALQTATRFRTAAQPEPDAGAVDAPLEDFDYHTWLG